MIAQRTRVKICGITNADDAAMAVAAGADALGVVLAPSKRRVDIERAAAALAEVSALVARIGVFVDADEAFVDEAVARIGLTAVQFHGDESPEACAAVNVPVIKALRVGDIDSRGVLSGAMTRYHGAVDSLLVDTYVPGAVGGTGTAFDWSVLGRLDDMPLPVIVAGGLKPENVGDAVRVMRPFAVDVSSGVEFEPGRKDPRAMRALVAAVRAADLEVR